MLMLQESCCLPTEVEKEGLRWGRAPLGRNKLWQGRRQLLFSDQLLHLLTFQFNNRSNLEQPSKMPFPLLGSQPMLGPVVGLASWTFVMEAWMYAYRIPDMSKYNVDVKPGMSKEDMNSKIPRHRQYPADNYNHLMEQPTQFYAIALALNALGAQDKTTVSLAWTYVGLRIIHSLVHATSNVIMTRYIYLVLSGSARQC